LSFLVIGPSFTSQSILLANQYKAGTNWDVAMVTVEGLKHLAERWAAAELDKPFPVRSVRRIHVICDNAAFHKSRRVQDYLRERGHRIVLHFLPRCAPETNPIERVWWQLRETLTRNHRCAPIEELLADVFEWVAHRRCFYGSELVHYTMAA
jgi:DDE superfamily endonuclease